MTTITFNEIEQTVREMVREGQKRTEQLLQYYFETMPNEFVLPHLVALRDTEDWKNTEFDLYESTSTQTPYKVLKNVLWEILNTMMYRIYEEEKEN